jgi:hypothetical protein
MRFLLGLMWLLHWLPLPVLGRFGSAVGSLLFMLLKKRRHIALVNLRLCMPELSEAARVRLARQHFQSYSRSVWERAILWWAPEARLRRLIRVEPGVPLAQLQAGPVILLCPHFVCLDVAGVAVMLESTLCSIYVQQKNKAFDEVLRLGRSRFRPVQLFSRKEGVKPIIRAMREHLPYFMLPDMDFGAKDAEFVPFFGIPDRARAHRRRHRRGRDSRGGHLPARLRRLEGDVLSGLGGFSRRRHGRIGAPHERLHRGAGARGAGRVLLDPQALQDAPAGRTVALYQKLESDILAGMKL